MTTFRFAPLALAAAIAVTGLQTAAFAGTPFPNGRSESVVTADLNLASPQGQATLDRRIAAAAAKVCATPDNRNARMLAEARKCEEIATDMAHVVRDQMVAAAVARELRTASVETAKPAAN
jgi:UrcA family protein